MKFWQSVIYLDAVRKGLTDKQARSLFRSRKEYIRSGLHVMGLSYDRIDGEYPDRLLGPDIKLAKNQPKEFDRAVAEAEEWFCSRN